MARLQFNICTENSALRENTEKLKKQQRNVRKFLVTYLYC